MRSLLASVFALVACAVACTTFGPDTSDAGADAGGTSGTSSTSGTSGTTPPDPAEAPPKAGATVTCGSTTCGAGQACCVVNNLLGCVEKCTTPVACDSDDDCEGAYVCCGTLDNSSMLVRTACTRTQFCSTGGRNRHICRSDADCDGQVCSPLPKTPFKACSPK